MAQLTKKLNVRLTPEDVDRLRNVADRILPKRLRGKGNRNINALIRHIAHGNVLLTVREEYAGLEYDGLVDPDPGDQ